MIYADVSVIVNGALEEERTFHDETLMNDYLGQIEDEAKGDGIRTEIYVLWHEHDDMDGCACIQYATDHHPYAVYDYQP
jgi:hypothetical protein